MAEPQQPRDPITPLAVRCVAMHEHYTELVAAGFTHHEAMSYLIGITKGTK